MLEVATAEDLTPPVTQIHRPRTAQPLGGDTGAQRGRVHRTHEQTQFLCALLHV